MPANPHFQLSIENARAERERMRRAPVKLERPVLVLAGYRAWTIMPITLAKSLRTMTGAPKSMFGAVAYPISGSFDHAAKTVLRGAEALAGTDGETTGEVDVVAVSMGGLVARYLASPLWKGRRLKVRRMFTLATPHRGAKLAKVVRPDAAARAMKPGSELLTALNALARDYELICYARLRDWWVGARNCAPPGMEPIWVPTPVLTMAHLLVSTDKRLLVDIARRLRGEEPIGKAGQAPPRD